MPVSGSAATGEFLFEAAGHGAEELLVVRFRGSEGISRPFEFEVEIACDDADLDLASFVGEPAVFTCRGAEADRAVHGLVAEFERVAGGRAHTFYRARLVPKIWTLGLRRNSRVFPPKTTRLILEDVFKDAGLTTNDYEFRLKRTYKDRKYCVQYRETDLDFVTRLMEDEGMFYFFAPADDRCVLVVADDAQKCDPIAGEAAVPFEESGSGLLGPDQVTAFRFAQSMRPEGSVLRDFDFKSPARSLKAEGGDGAVRFHVYDYPGDFPDEKLGAEYAAIRLEQERAERRLGAGEGGCRRFLPGHRFTLEGHRRAELNREYLIVRVEHEGDQRRAAGADDLSDDVEVPYRNAFECVPSDAAYRAPRVTPRPHVDGPLFATVVGPDGSEIHCDEFGRVKIKFQWDRSDRTDDSASHWVRVCQGWGGAGYGTIFLPRVGQEVVVEHLEGNPDRPIVTGRVYNGESMPPYGLPDQKTMSTIMSQTSPGGGSSNEVRMEDAVGAMQLFLHASKNMVTVVKDAKTEEVGVNERLSVGGDRTREVAREESVRVGRNRTVDVGGKDRVMSLGARSVDVGGSQTITIGGSKAEVIGKALDEKAGGNKKSEVGAACVRVVRGDSSESAGGNYVTLCGVHMRRVKGSEKVEAKAARTLNIAGAYFAKIGGSMAHSVKSKFAAVVAGAFLAKATNVSFEAQDKITLAAGGSTITVTPSEIEIKGVTVKADFSGVGLSGSSVKMD